MESNLFDIGDRVKVIKYGSLLWENKGDGKVNVRDMRPEVVGEMGIVSKVNLCQGKYTYALDRIKGFHAWYNEEQLEMVNRNPNNDDAANT